MDTRLQLLKRTAQSEGTSEAWQSYAAALERLASGDDELTREQLKAVAIAAVQELNRIDDAKPCLYASRDDNGGTLTRCEEKGHEDRRIWIIGQESNNHGHYKFYGTSKIDGEMVVLAPHSVDDFPSDNAYNGYNL